MKQLESAIEFAALLVAPLFGWIVAAGAVFLVCSVAFSADPVPIQVTNKIPPQIVVVNKIPAPKEKPQTVPGVAPRPGEPIKVTPGVVINRPFSDSTAVMIAPATSGTAPPTSGVVLSSPQSPAVTAEPILTLAPGVGRVGGIECVGFT